MMTITKEIAEAMIAHAKRDVPIEACGYLGGAGGCIRKIYEMTNVDNSSEHFSFDPKEQFKVLKKSREEGVELIGCYHSHPVTPARMSQEDIRLAHDPNMLYVIVSLADSKPDIKAFKVRKGTEIQIDKVDMEIV